MDERLVTELLPVLANKPREEFNVFNVMRYGGHEKQLSDVFAWLLDAEGTHKLDDAFVRIFIDEVNRGLRDAVNRGLSGYEPIAYGSYGVRQEVNTAEVGEEEDIADLVLEDDKTVLVIENYYTSSGHGHGYDTYLKFGERQGKRGVVVLLCVAQNSAELSEGWEKASVVIYSSLLQRLVDNVVSNERYRRDCAAQYSFIDQMHKRFVKGLEMNDDALIDFIEAMCKTGEARRYGERPIEPAGLRFADDLREQARAQFDESRDVLRRVKTALRNYAAVVLKAQINEALDWEYITDVRIGLQGIYEWTVNFFTTGESEAVLQLKFGPSAWHANEDRTGDWGSVWWEETVPIDQADYSHLFITRIKTKAIRQSVVTLNEVLEGLSPDDFRLRDEIVRFLPDRV